MEEGISFVFPDQISAEDRTAIARLLHEAAQQMNLSIGSIQWKADQIKRLDEPPSVRARGLADLVEAVPHHALYALVGVVVSELARTLLRCGRGRPREYQTVKAEIERVAAERGIQDFEVDYEQLVEWLEGKADYVKAIIRDRKSGQRWAAYITAKRTQLRPLRQPDPLHGEPGT